MYLCKSIHIPFSLCCSFCPLHFPFLKSHLRKISPLLTLTTKHSAAISLTNSSFDILCLDKAMKYNQFVHYCTRRAQRCMYTYMCVYTLGAGGADGQHKLALVWGLDQCQVIITDPPCGVSMTPGLCILTFNPLATPVKAGTGWTGPCGRDSQTRIHPICCFLFFTPSHILLLIQPGWSRSEGCRWMGGPIEGKTNRAGGQGLD